MLRKDFFSNETTHAYCLGIACDNLFGVSWLEWEPKTVYQGIVELGYQPVSETNAQKLHAYRTGVATLLPWTDWLSFETTINGLNGVIVNFTKSTPCKISHLMAGMDILRLLQQQKFGDEVKKYIASCGKNAELNFLPDPLTFCMPYLCRPMYKCNDCGNTDVDDLSDGRCDFCVGRYEQGILIDAPQKGLENRGTNITKFMEYDYFELANKFDAYKQLSEDKILLGISPLEIQLAKLLQYNYYRKEMRFQMNEQLQEIKHAGFKNV